MGEMRPGWQKTESFGVAGKNDTKFRANTFLKIKGEALTSYTIGCQWGEGRVTKSLTEAKLPSKTGPLSLASSLSDC